MLDEGKISHETILLTQPLVSSHTQTSLSSLGDILIILVQLGTGGCAGGGTRDLHHPLSGGGGGGQFLPSEAASLNGRSVTKGIRCRRDSLVCLKYEATREN
jgi:hypothetical protein